MYIYFLHKVNLINDIVIHWYCLGCRLPILKHMLHAFGILQKKLLCLAIVFSILE